MNVEKQSLEENKAAILAALPAEFHSDFEAQLADTAPAPAPLSGEALIAAIKAELKENPNVDEKAAAAELTDIKAPKL
jgi:hypothetical protein